MLVLAILCFVALVVGAVVMIRGIEEIKKGR